MSEICTICGLPKELCVCGAIAKERQEIIVRTEKRKFGKKYTVIEGINEKDIDMKNLLKQLKNKLACGGAAKEGRVELQGDHKQKIKTLLVQFGFAPETIATYPP